MVMPKNELSPAITEMLEGLEEQRLAVPQEIINRMLKNPAVVAALEAENQPPMLIARNQTPQNNETQNAPSSAVKPPSLN